MLATAAPCTATSRAAASAGRRKRYRTIGRDRLHFDDGQSRRSGLQGQLRGFRAAASEDVQHQFLPVERPFQINQIQIQLPFIDSILPFCKRRLGLAAQFGMPSFIFGRGPPQHALRRLFAVAFGNIFRCAAGSTWANRLQRRSQFQPAVREDHDPLVPRRGLGQIVRESGDFGNSPITYQ